jgi:hypothetical protein
MAVVGCLVWLNPMGVGASLAEVRAHNMCAGIQLLRGEKYGRYKHEALTTTIRQNNAHHHHQSDSLCQKLFQVNDLTS